MRKPNQVERTTRSSGLIALRQDYSLNEVGTKLMHLRDFTRHPVAAFVKGIQRLNFGLLVLFLLASSLPQVSKFFLPVLLCFARSHT